MEEIFSYKCLYVLHGNRSNDILSYGLFTLGKLPAQPWFCPYRVEAGKCAYKPNRQTYQSKHCHSPIKSESCVLPSFTFVSFLWITFVICLIPQKVWYFAYAVNSRNATRLTQNFVFIASVELQFHKIGNGILWQFWLATSKVLC